MFARMHAPIAGDYLGGDLICYGFCGDGRLYYCKKDKDGRPIRAIEVISASIAEHLGIAVAPWVVVEVDDDLLFGSQQHPSPVQETAVRTFCVTPEQNELGMRLPWRGSYFSRLYVLDMFLGNVDRQIRNLVGFQEGRTVRVQAIDFAASRLVTNPGVDISQNGSHTRRFGRTMRGVHGYDTDAAIEMVERLGSLPTSFVESVIDRLPPGWLDENRASRFVEFWGGGERKDRLANLGAGLKDGSFL